MRNGNIEVKALIYSEVNLFNLSINELLENNLGRSDWEAILKADLEIKGLNKNKVKVVYEKGEAISIIPISD